MKGILNKTAENGWVIRRWINDPMYHGSPGFPRLITETIQLHPDETDMDALIPNPEGEEVEFEFKEEYVEPEGIHCNRGGNKKYAVIIEPKDTWENIQDMAAKDGVDIPINWFKERYNPPTKK